MKFIPYYTTLRLREIEELDVETGQLIAFQKDRFFASIQYRCNHEFFVTIVWQALSGNNQIIIIIFAVQWVENKGQCGVCGDAYHLKEPRPHEAGGEYAKGTIVRHYTVGQVIPSLFLYVSNVLL